MTYVLREIKSKKFVCKRGIKKEEDFFKIQNARLYDNYETALAHKESWDRFSKCEFIEIVRIGDEMIKKEERIEFDEYFLKIAQVVSERATCKRLKVGCVITENNRIISTGYNGSPTNKEHCTDVGCLLNNEGRCIRTVHAEQNAIISLPYTNGDFTLYVTHYPCEHCSKLIAQSGIKRVVYLNAYENEFSKYFLNTVKVEQFKGDMNAEIR